MAEQASKDERIRALEKELREVREALERVQKAQEDSRGRIRCPKCAFQMDEQVRQGIIVDVCRGCRGVYFDDGEVDALIQAVTAAHPAAEEQAGLLRRLFGRGA